jgi:hypothetical protein
MADLDQDIGRGASAFGRRPVPARVAGTSILVIAFRDLIVAAPLKHAVPAPAVPDPALSSATSSSRPHWSTLYLPPLFPTLLRTTGAGFCYNIGRIASAVGTVAFGVLSTVHDYRTALIAAGCLFLPAGWLALGLPDLDDRDEP